MCLYCMVHSVIHTKTLIKHLSLHIVTVLITVLMYVCNIQQIKEKHLNGMPLNKTHSEFGKHAWDH